MNATHLGFYNTSSSRTHVRFQFSTHAAAGGNVAPNSAFEAADLRIYKATDGAAFSATQRSSANGITMTSPFDSLTGFHDVDIDLTDNTDAGFYASGGFYSIVLAPDETVDSQTLTGVVLAYFEIGVAKADVTQFGGTAGTFSSGRPEVNTTHAAGTAWASGAITAASIASDAITAAKIANGAIDAATFAADVDAEILSYLVDDATRIDASALNTASVTTIPAILTDTAEIGAAGAGLTAVASAANLATVAGYLDTEVAAIQAVTDKLDDTLEDDGGTYRFTTNALEQAPSGSGSGATAQEVWEYATRTLTALDEDSTTLDLDATIRGAVGLASNNLDSQLSAIDDFLDTEIAAILAAVDTEVAAILALLDDARTEPGQGAPPVNPDAVTKLDYLYKWARNKKDNDGSVTNYYADNGTTVDQKQTTTESGGTVTVSEMITGA